MLGRYVRTAATGVAFTLVGVGLAYAVPQSLGGPRVPERTHGARAGSEHDRGGAHYRRWTSASPRSESGSKATGKRSGIGDAARNHGAAVRVAAHCDVRGKAHGELVRSIAGDEDASVADATAACARAEAETDRSGGSGKPAKPATPAKPAKPATPAKPVKPAKPAKPATPVKPAKPFKPTRPATPAKPATPATPARPAKPAKPDRGKPDSAGNADDDHGPKKVRPVGRLGRPRRPR
jgi:hypothetical protein